MMKKNGTKGYVILGILFVLISVFAFVVPTAKTTTFWIAYVFTAAAFVAQIGIWKIALGKAKTIESKFLGLPVVYIGVLYAIIQVIAFAVFMFMPTLPVWSAIVACAAIACISAVCMISAEVGRGEIEKVEAKAQKKVFYIRTLQADVELLADGESEANVKMALSKLAEKIRFSDPMSNEQLADLEDEISGKVARLKDATNKMEIITELNSLLNERNKKCKILK